MRAKDIKKGYYWVKFYNHEEKQIMLFNGKNFEGFKSDKFIHDEIESYEPIERGQNVDASENTLLIHGVIARFSDELIDSVIHELNAYGHNYDHYEFGLPTYDEHMDNMRNIVKVKLNGL